jgi:uncharacterized protein (UPF0264 family)
MAKLLASVRSMSEAQAAVEGGASIIDVKEPLQGPLGPADPSTIAGVIESVDERVPISAAMGEIMENSEITPIRRLDYVKWGLAKGDSRWRERLLRAAASWTEINSNCLPVAVAYADWQQAQSPPPTAVWTFARDNGWRILLLDTFSKGKGTLLNWMSLDDIHRMIGRCRDHNMLIALAGSLGVKEITGLLSLQPDIFAVRGCVCRGHDRTASVDATLVRQLSGLLNSPKVNFHLPVTVVIGQTV